VDASVVPEVGGKLIDETPVPEAWRGRSGLNPKRNGGAARVVAGDGGKGFLGLMDLGGIVRAPSVWGTACIQRWYFIVKVFGVIDRFSEDIDLSVSPGFLDISEELVEQAASRNQRTRRMEELETACSERVRDRFLPELERIATEALGQRRGGAPWMEFQIDLTTRSPGVLFHYPSNAPPGFEYLRRFVKLEFGSLTDQRPVGKHAIRPWVAEIFPDILPDFHCDVVERTFWEKATILHSEYHRETGKPLRDSFSRHYSDTAALARDALAETALARDDLRRRVVDWKSRFFPANWARYDLAKPGTFRLAPPIDRLPELRRDYRAMQDMFFRMPPPFEEMLNTIRDLERRINRSA